MTAPTTIDEYLELVTKSGLADPERLEEALKELRAGSAPFSTPKELATSLVKQGVRPADASYPHQDGRLDDLHESPEERPPKAAGHSIYSRPGRRPVHQPPDDALDRTNREKKPSLVSKCSILCLVLYASATSPRPDMKHPERLPVKGLSR